MRGIDLQKLTPASPVTDLPGISEKRAEAFARAGVRTVEDLVRFYPRSYEFRGRVKPLSEAESGESAAFLVTVKTEPKLVRFAGGMWCVQCTVSDGTADAAAMFFRMPYMKKSLTAGAFYRMYGRVGIKAGKRYLYCPKCELSFDGCGPDGRPLPPVVPVYRKVSGVPQKLLASLVSSALDVVYPRRGAAADTLPFAVREKYGLAAEGYAIRALHQPENEQMLGSARRRILFEELFLFAMRLCEAKRRRRHTAPLPCRAELAPFLAAIPFSLTGAQSRVIEEFRRDMSSQSAPMYRVLSGDVGSGKTVCAAAAAYLAAASGYQVSLMAPTEILARQHYEDLAPLFSAFGMQTALLVGSMKKSEKTAVKQGLSSGEISLVIGTHALIEDDVAFSRLGLVITDEQHRFGVLQRAAIEQKTEGVHVLLMSATPIPRTLAMVLFGEVDHSELDEMPPGRKPVSTHLLDESYRERLNGYIREQAAAGKAVYIVCPAIEEDEETGIPMSEGGLCSAVEYAKNLRENVFPDLPVGLVHGRMRPAEKDRVMASFVAGECNILVATTVIEVGVNVPRAVMMVVENAERFGLSQLHQLRGRVGRGTDKSYCFLMSQSTSETAQERLGTLCRTHDGFAIAKADLAQRGPGDFFSAVHEVGTYRQSGMLHFGLSDPMRDDALFREAFEAAREYLAADPELDREEDCLIVRRLAEYTAG